MVYLALGAFVLLADRVARIARRGRRERARREADYPLTDTTNWRFPTA
jgi:hypothetical protein